MFHVEQFVLDNTRLYLKDSRGIFLGFDMKNEIIKNVPRGTLDKLKVYEQLLVKWQNTINIVSRGTIGDAWNRHFLDSLQLLPIVNYEIKKLQLSEKCKILDVGSGGGFPGMVLAITDNYNVTCVDSDQRKMLFLSEVARQTGTNVSLSVSRIEDITQNNFNIVTARGFSSLDNLLKIICRNTNDGVGIFLKGKCVKQEIANAHLFYDFEHELHESITDKEGRIIIVRQVKTISKENEQH